MKRTIVVYFLLVVLAASGMAQKMPPDDPRLSSFEDWNPTPWNSKVAYVNGVIVGAWYLAAAYAWENRTVSTPPITHLIPYDIRADRLVNLIDAVYSRPENRKTPIVKIIIYWKEFASQYGYNL